MTLRKKIIQYANLGRVKGKLDHLLRDLEFTSIAKAYPMMKEQVAHPN
jgi:hypothetical protein